MEHIKPRNISRTDESIVFEDAGGSSRFFVYQSMISNGLHDFVPLDSFVWIKNESSKELSFEIPFYYPCNQGHLHKLEYKVNPNGSILLGPLSERALLNPENNFVRINYSFINDVEVLCLKRGDH